jgi:hypothetical protein
MGYPRPGRTGSGWPAVAALLAGAGLATGCAGVHIYSPSLDTATAAAAKNLPPEAEALKPFDDQLGNLGTFATQENQAAARFWVGVRDAHFVRLIAMDGSTDRSKRLASEIDNRLIVLTGSATVNTPTDPAASALRKAELESHAASQRRAYLRAPKAESGKDLSCAGLRKYISDDQAAVMAASNSNTDSPLGQIVLICRNIDAHDLVINQFATLQGAIGEANRAAQAVAANTSTDLSDRGNLLQDEIAAAKDFSEKDASVEKLRQFQKDLKKILDPAKLGAQAVGWTQAGDAIDKLLKGQLCGASEVDDATKNDAKCGKDAPTSTTARVEATWGLAKALAQLSDANNPRRRSTNWLLAARAIISAEQADAALALQEAKAEAAAAAKRVVYLQRELVYLAAAKKSATGPRPTCHQGRPGGDRGPNPHCLFAAYVDAWNEGRIPAEILLYQPVQIQRSFAVQRARTVAQMQYTLTAAGTGTLKDYGAGGLKAALIAQGLFDAAIVGFGIGGL